LPLLTYSTSIWRPVVVEFRPDLWRQ